MSQSKSTDNLALWSQVEETAPGFTKTVRLDGREVTAISGQYMVKRATELFGPIGEGWGYEIKEERFDQGGPVLDATGKLMYHEVIHTILLRLWYAKEGNRHEVMQYGHTPYIRSTKYGAKTDFDYGKKSLTDAMKKCLSLLGFSADIFMGMFDDQDYVESAKMKEQIQKAESADDEKIRMRTEFGEWAERELAMYEQVPSRAALRMMHQGHIKKIRRDCQVLGINPEKAIDRFNSALSERMEILDPDIELVCPGCGVTGKGKNGSPCIECQTKRSPA